MRWKRWEIVRLYLNKCKLFRWKMSFGTHGAWSPDRLPDVLQKHCVMAYPDNVIGGSKKPHLMGFSKPSQEVIDAISKHFNQYLELKMPFGLDSYVWPSYQEPNNQPIRCPSREAIDHFYCHL